MHVPARGTTRPPDADSAAIDTRGHHGPDPRACMRPGRAVWARRLRQDDLPWPVTLARPPSAWLIRLHAHRLSERDREQLNTHEDPGGSAALTISRDTCIYRIANIPAACRRCSCLQYCEAPASAGGHVHCGWSYVSVMVAVTLQLQLRVTPFHCGAAFVCSDPAAVAWPCNAGRLCACGASRSILSCYAYKRVNGNRQTRQRNLI